MVLTLKVWYTLIAFSSSSIARSAGSCSFCKWTSLTRCTSYRRLLQCRPRRVPRLTKGHYAGTSMEQVSSNMHFQQPPSNHSKCQDTSCDAPVIVSLMRNWLRLCLQTSDYDCSLHTSVLDFLNTSLFTTAPERVMFCFLFLKTTALSTPLHPLS